MEDMSEEELKQEQEDGAKDQEALEEAGLIEDEDILIQKDKEIEDLKKELEICKKLKEI